MPEIKFFLEALNVLANMAQVVELLIELLRHRGRKRDVTDGS